MHVKHGEASFTFQENFVNLLPLMVIAGLQTLVHVLPRLVHSYLYVDAGHKALLQHEGCWGCDHVINAATTHASYQCESIHPSICHLYDTLGRVITLEHTCMSATSVLVLCLSRARLKSARSPSRVRTSLIKVSYLSIDCCGKVAYLCPRYLIELRKSSLCEMSALQRPLLPGGDQTASIRLLSGLSKPKNVACIVWSLSRKYGVTLLV